MTAAIADWVVTVATAVGVFLAVWQLRQNAKIAGQTHARDAWIRYLEHGFQHPEYGSTELAMQCLGVSDVRQLWNEETPENERYWWFLDIMMESSESLINFFPQREWQNTIKFNLRLHAVAIRLMWKGEKQFYSDLFCELVEEVLAEGEHERVTRLPYPRYLLEAERETEVVDVDRSDSPEQCVDGTNTKDH
ncbi:MAG TPA: hypothetical protein VEB68_03770 [Croceibacterium sp.]|nr:hypothetical protein [Croceibacterium sp.]